MTTHVNVRQYRRVRFGHLETVRRHTRSYPYSRPRRS